MAKLTLNKDDYDKGLDDAKGKASGFGDKLKSGFSTAGKVVAGVTTAIVGMSAAFIKGAGDVASYGDNIDKMSQKMGISSTAYQEWEAIMQHSGTSMETLKSGMKTLANAVEKGNDAFTRLGISQEQIASMSNEDLFSATISALQNVENETERTYLAGQLLGRGATELGALLNMSAEETDQMRQRVHELGGVMSTDAVKAAAQYQDSLQDMKTAFSGISRNIIGEFLPSMSTVMDGLGNVFSGNGGLSQISEGINGFISKLNEIIPKVVETGSTIVTALSTAIISNLPSLFSAGTQIILLLITGIIQQLPQIATAAISIITELATGLGSALPELIPAVVQAVITIVQTLLENVPLLVSAAAELIVGLATGLINAIPQLIEAAPVIIAELATALIGAIPEILSAAWEIMQALGQALYDAAPASLQNVIDAIGNAFRQAWETVKVIWDVVAPYFQAIWAAIQAVWNVVAPFFKAIFQSAWDGIKTIWNVATSFFSAVWNSIAAVFSVVRSVLTGDFQGAWDGIRSIVGTWAAYFANVWSAIKGHFANVGAFFANAFNSAKSAIVNAVSSIPAYFSQLWSNIKSVFSNVGAWFSSVGQAIVNGIRNGISAGWSALTGFIAEKARGLLNAAKSALGIASPSKLFRDQVGLMITQGVAEGVTKGQPGLIRAIENTMGRAVDTAKMSVDEIESLTSKALDAVSRTYEKTSGSGKNKITEIITKTKDEYANELYKSAETTFNNYKKLHDTSLTDEVNYWRRISAAIETGTEARENAEAKLADAVKTRNETITSYNEKLLSEEKKLAENSAKINDKLASDVAAARDKLLNNTEKLWDKYHAAVDARASKIYSGLGGLFKVFEQDTKFTTDTLVSNLSNQLDALKTWSADIDMLASRGIADGLLSELKDMGPAAAADIHLLTQLSESELKKYSDMWEEATSISTQIAREENEQLRLDTVAQIDKMRTEAYAKIDELNAQAATELKKLQSDFADTATKMAQEAVDKIGSMPESFKDIGLSSAKGLADGIKAGQSAIIASAVAAAGAALSAVKKELGIASPSRVFRDEVGRMMAKGIAQGFTLEMPRTFRDIQKQLDYTDRLKYPTNGVSRETEKDKANGITVVQNIYSEAKTAADLMREARWEAQKAVLVGV